MKRFLSLFLVLCTLLCLIPMAVSAEEAAPEAQAEATASYLDLYVKDGLVSLLDGFAVEAAGRTTQKLLTPAALYGVDGYEDYIDPTLYTADVLYTGQGFGEYVYQSRFTDGAFSFVKRSNGNRDAVNYKYYVDLDDLGALLGTTYTVQEIFTVTPQFEHSEGKNIHGQPTVTDGALDKWNFFSGDIYANDQSLYGALNLYFCQKGFTESKFTGTDYATWSGGGVMVPWIQIGGSITGGYGGHIIFVGNGYTATKYASLLLGETTYENAYVSNGYATIEQTVIRNGYTDNGDGTYTSKYSISYAAGEFRRMGSFQNGNMVSLSTNNVAQHNTTALRVMATTGADYYSTRIYNKVLSAAEIAQNHFADLLGFYKVDGALIAKVLALPAYLQSGIYTEFTSTQIVNDGYADATYASAKASFETALAAAVASAASEDYISLYAKENLVALFNAFDGTASMGTTTGAFAPVNLYGVDGYDAYIDPTTYAANLVGNWTWLDGALRPATTNGTSYLDLNALGALLDQTYTVQEILGFNNTVKPTVDAEGNVDSTGATKFGGYFTSQIGSFKYGPLNGTWQVGASTYGPTNINAHYALHDQVWFAGSYLDCYAFLTEDYNVTIYDNVYMTVKDVEYTNWGIAGPTAIERTTFRLGVTDDGAGKYTSTFKISFPFEYNVRNGNSNMYLGTGKSWSHASTAQADHYATTLKLAGSGADIYSIRIYDNELSASAIKQNRMADLVAFYDIDVTAVKALNPIALASFIDGVQGIRLAFCGKDTANAEYIGFKAQIEELITESANETAYLDMYVKDGLVALFDFHGIKAEDNITIGTTSQVIKALDLSGVEGFDDYVSPASYNTNYRTGGNRVNWVSANGGMQANRLVNDDKVWNSDAGFVLSELGAMIGTTYSVQEVFSYVNYIPVVENGVITNYATTFPISHYGGGWELGALTGGTSPAIAKGVDGVNNVYMVPVDQLSFNGGYSGHWTYLTNGAATLGNYTATAANGSEVVLENYYVASTSTWERTMIRLGDYTASEPYEVDVKDKDGNVTGQKMVVDYTGTYKTIWNVAPWHRPNNWNWKAPNTTFSVKTTVDEGNVVASTSLVLANNGLTRSIRVYNKELTQAEVMQNHVADLMAVYGTSAATIADVKAMSAALFADFAEAAFAIEIGETDAEYREYKADFEECISEYLGKVDALVADVLSFGGISYRTMGNWGMRTLYTVDTEAVATLEEYGYTVIYGAIMAIANNDGTTYNAAASDVTVDVVDGKVALATGNAAAFVSSDNGLKYLTEDNASFAFTTIFPVDGAGDALRKAEMFYRGFTVLADAEGNVVTIVYDEYSITDELALEWGLATPSIWELHDYAMAANPFMDSETRTFLLSLQAVRTPEDEF